MAQVRCFAPRCKSAGSSGHDLRDLMAVDPELCEYREIPLCPLCAADARDAGARTVELFEARRVIKRHELDVERKQFFLQFVPAQEENQAMSA